MFQRVLLLLVLVFLPTLSASAQRTPLVVSDAYQSSYFIDRIIGFNVSNTGDRPEAVRGRVVVLNVYSASPPLSLPLGEWVLQPHTTEGRWTRWHDAPSFGQVRATIILNEGLPNATVASYTFWIWPDTGTMASVLIALALALLLVRLVFRRRLPKKPKGGSEKKPASARPEPPPTPPPPPKPKPLGPTFAYRVEPDDTLMTLSARFDVGWQDLARANRLKPPYALVPGSTLQVPRHALKRKTPSDKT